MVAELRSREDADMRTALGDGQLQESVDRLTSDTGRLRGELATVRENWRRHVRRGKPGLGHLSGRRRVSSD